MVLYKYDVAGSLVTGVGAFLKGMTGEIGLGDPDTRNVSQVCTHKEAPDRDKTIPYNAGS